MTYEAPRFDATVPHSQRPADFPAQKSSKLVTILVVVAVVAFVLLRSVGPLSEAISGGGRDQEGLLFAVLAPAIIVVILIVLVGIRLSPYLRARRLREQFPNALVTTGQWIRETRAFVPEKRGGVFVSYTMVVDAQGVAFYTGFFRGELLVRIPRSDIAWVNSQMIDAWRQQQPGLILASASRGQVPLLLIAFSSPLRMVPGRGRLTEISTETRRQLGLG